MGRKALLDGLNERARELLARATCLVVVLLALAPAAAARAASVWTPVASGTTQTISAIAAGSAGEVVFATTGGSIGRLVGGRFVAATVAPPNPNGFTDVALSPDGSEGVAVGPQGMIYRSTDGGGTWSQVSGTQTFTSGCNNLPSGGPAGSLVALTDSLFSVKFADANTVYVTGGNDDVLKSVDGGATFVEVNKRADETCVANPGEGGGGAGEGITDSAWIDANHGFLLSNFFGRYFQTSDGFATASTEAEGVNGSTYIDRLALDPRDPSRAWAISGGARNGSYFQYTTDGGASWNNPSYDDNQVGLQDIATNGTAVVTVGLGGDIYSSADGRAFSRHPAGAPYTGTDWHSVVVLPGGETYVGGAGGALLWSANPIATRTVPTVSDPVSKSGGGATIVIYRHVIVTRARYIPVLLSAKKPRRFVVSLLKGNHLLARVTATLPHGDETVQVQLNFAKLNPTYTVQVSVSTTGRNSDHAGYTLRQKVKVT
jgi:photosystem II stability/assembly factor-like uncharacterized protein